MRESERVPVFYFEKKSLKVHGNGDLFIVPAIPAPSVVKSIQR